MNAGPEIATTETLPSLPASSTPFAYRGNGKVARLPKPLRDRICTWMLDGISYPDIIERLGPDAKDLNPGHLCEWRKRGYQDWLLEQAWLARTRARQEPAADLSANFDATMVGHAALQLGTLHIFEALRDLSHSSSDSESSSFSSSSSPSPSDAPSSAIDARRLPIPPAATPRPGVAPSPPLQGRAGEGRPTLLRSDPPRSDAPRRSALDLRLGGDSAAFVRLMNALARASRETMMLQKYREACAKAREAIQVLKDPKRKLTDSERHAIVSHVDDILGIRWDNNEQLVPPEPAPSFPSASPALRCFSEEGSSACESSSSSLSCSSLPPAPASPAEPQPGERESSPAAPKRSEAGPPVPSLKPSEPVDSRSTAAQNDSTEDSIAQLSF